jgi:hypothetical protein
MISIAPFALPEVWLFAFTATGLLLLPAALGRWANGVLAAFTVLGLILIAASELPVPLQPSRSVAIWFLVTQVSWLLLIPDLFARGRIAKVIDEIPLRPLLALGCIHFLGVRHLFSAMQGELSAGLALWITSGEFFSALGAVVLWTFFRPHSRWFLFAVLFWNAHALFTTLEFSTKLFLAHPGIPILPHPNPELFGYFSTWPGSLEALFWTPFYVCLHLALFYKLLTNRRGTPAEYPGTAP